MNNSVSNVASSLHRQPGQLQNQPHQHNIHKFIAYQPNKMRPSANPAGAPRHPQSVGMASPRNMQPVSHNLQHFNPPQPSVSGRGQQQPSQKTQQQRLVYCESARAANVSQVKRMTTPRFSKPTIRPQTRLPMPGQSQHFSPNQVQEPTSQTQIQRSSSATLQSRFPLKSDNFAQSIPRVPPQQSQHKVFSVPRQRLLQHRQDVESDDKMPHMQGMREPEFEDEAMYDDEEDEDYNEEMDDEEIEYPGFPGIHDYDYPSSDSDELSEEESALLEELRYCNDDVRYMEIISRLEEKGVDPEEIEELLYHNNYPQGMYSEENLVDYDDGHEDETEEIVSSSSQSQMPLMQNQPRSVIHAIPLHEHAQSVASSTRPGGHIQKMPPSLHGQQGTSSHSIPVKPTDGLGQQEKRPRPHDLQFQSQQQVSASCPPASDHTSSQRQAQQMQQHKQQSELKLLGQTKKVFKSSSSQVAQSTSQTDSGQPLQNEVGAQPQQRQEDPSHLLKKDVSLLGPIESVQAPNSSQMNTPPQSFSQTRRPQDSSGSSSVRPVPKMTALEKDENQSSVSHSLPLQQPGINKNQSSQLGGLAGTPPVIGLSQKVHLKSQQKPHVPQSMAGIFGSGQLQDSVRPGKPVSHSIDQPQGLMHSPQLRATLDKNTAPSEASIARLNVEYMQQSLDKEIKAKKKVPPAPAHLSGLQNPSAQHSFPKKLSSPQSINRFPRGHFQALRPRMQLPRAFPAYQPRHQLPPRQPNPDIIKPSSSTNKTFSAGKPVCSVVPFTPEKQGQTLSTNDQIVNAPQQSKTSKPQNPAPISLQGSTTNPHHSPDLLQNRTKTSAAPHCPASLSAGSSVAVSSSPKHENAAPLVSNKNVISEQPKPDLPKASTSKQDTFSLDQLSQDKCIITGKGKHQSLVVNMVYQIRSPIDGSFVLALWNGEKFEDLKQTGLTTSNGSQPNEKSLLDVQKAQSEQATVPNEKDKSKVVTSLATEGSVSRSRSEFLQSLAQESNESKQSCTGAEPQPPASQDVDSERRQTANVNAQKTVGGVPSSQSPFVKPLSQGEIQQRKEQPMDESSGDDDAVFKKPFTEQDEDYFRVCQFCGYASKNFRRCESCRRVFRGEVKIESLKKQSVNNGAAATSSSRPESKKNLKSSGSALKEDTGEIDAFNQVTDSASENPYVKGRGQYYQEDNEGSDSEDSSVDEKKDTADFGSSSDGPGKRRPALKLENPVPKKRHKKVDEPVTLTISSDEDEPSSTSNNLPSFAPSQASSADSESQGVPSFRRGLMQDEYENNRMGVRTEQQMMPPYMDRSEEEEEEDDEEEEEDEDGDCDDPPVYEVDVRSVRIGSMRTQPEGPLLIGLEGICIRVRSERTDETFEFEITPHEVERVKYFFGEIQPVLFLLATQDCGEKMRAICHMEAGDDEFFDPSSNDMKQKMIVIIIECFNHQSQEMLKETLSLWADLNQVQDDCFIEELTEESTNDLLIQSAPPVLSLAPEKDLIRFNQRYIRETDMALMSRTLASPSDSADNEPDSTSSSPPETRHYYGTSVRLLQYPPLPAKRLSITTEDLFCLTEGEFLNDVIIDFYLQYLYHEILSEENRRRTHIFSSFFYKRLTQRDRHNERSEEDAKKSLPERRHARVKKWTKTVDLFSKDFIIIPINENSHWYLALICFPGLANPEVVPFIPSAAHQGDPDDESSDVAGGEEGANEETDSHGSMSKTILGRQLDAKECDDSKDIKYSIGHKQPCILMFDSLAGPCRNINVRILRDYLQSEWNAKKSEPRQITRILQSCTPEVPQQSNFSDCGVYLLQYVESFFEDPIADFQIPMKGLKHWFHEELVYNKRREIHDLIMSLHRQFQKERGDPNILHIKFESTPREPPMMFNPSFEMSSTLYRDDENSNSAVSGEMRPELDPSVEAMEESSYQKAEDQGELQDESIDRLEDEDGR